MRSGISISLSPSERERLDRIVKDRNAAQKHVWRADIVLLRGDGVGTKRLEVVAAKPSRTFCPATGRWNAR